MNFRHSDSTSLRAVCMNKDVRPKFSEKECEKPSISVECSLKVKLYQFRISAPVENVIKLVQTVLFFPEAHFY